MLFEIFFPNFSCRLSNISKFSLGASHALNLLHVNFEVILYFMLWDVVISGGRRESLLIMQRMCGRNWILQTNWR